MQKTVNRIYGLDGLRFFSFLVVVINHVYGSLSWFGHQHHKPPYVISIGVFAIQYFFAGSGFLITYMLYAEQENTGTFHIGKFYMRRVLRIWPAYYLLLLITYFVVFNLGFFDMPTLSQAFWPYKQESIFYFFLFLPHIFHYLGNPGVPYLGQTYTIGIEEQFYLLWALIFKFFRKYFKVILLLLLIIGLGLNFFTYYVKTYHIEPSKFIKGVLAVADYYDYSRITTFCIGSFLAFWFKSNHKSLDLFKSTIFQIVFYIICAYIVYINFVTPVFYYEFKTILVSCLLSIAAFKKTSIINYSHPILEYLGKISYGVYLFHLIAIVIVIKIFDYLKYDLSKFPILVAIIVASCILSILFGMLSYHSIETYFLRFKKRFDFKKSSKTAEIGK